LKLIVNTRSGVPIYRQLVQQINNGIVGGILKPGEQLPTVREVALELTVNPNTVARAYRELEHSGILMSYQGRGTFVSTVVTAAHLEDKELIVRQKLQELMQEARQLNVKRARLEALFNEVLEGWEKEE
jgi:GntR family transcriptional regulator